MTRVAVVGGGIYGCAIAVDLARAGADVDLFEARSDLLDGSTSRHMGRLHSGYHYPRSDATATEARDTAAAFTARWPQAVRRARHWYAVAPGSKVTPDGYLAFLDRLGLPYEVAGRSDMPPQIHTAELVVRASEAFVDTGVLRRLLRADLHRAGVGVHTGRKVDGDLPGYDVTVWATYGVPWVRPLRYEVCEVALVELGRYGDDSFVVVDGEFVSLDPYGRLHTLYDVALSVHHAADIPDVPARFRPLLERGTVLAGRPGSELSRVDAMLGSASRFLWGLDPHGMHASIYHGSMWSLRAVLPDVDATDERPTLVVRDRDTVRVLAGKIGGAATVGSAVAAEVLGLVAA